MLPRRLAHYWYVAELAAPEGPVDREEASEEPVDHVKVSEEPVDPEEVPKGTQCP